MLSLILIGHALAGDRELDVHLSVQGSDDPGWTYLSEEGHLTSIGLRAGYPLHKHLVLVGGWEHGASGMEFNTYDDTGDDGSETSFQTGSYMNQFQLGVKSGWGPNHWAKFYGTVQADVLYGIVRIDDDKNDDENPGQVEATGVGFGVLGAAGFETAVPLGKSGVSLAFYGELGYTWLAPTNIGEVATIQIDGVSGRVGTGLRF